MPLEITKDGVKLIVKHPKLGSKFDGLASTCEEMVKVQQALLPAFKGLDVTLAANDMNKIQRALLRPANVPFFRRRAV